jgi:hypothetical protein
LPQRGFRSRSELGTHPLKESHAALARESTLDAPALAMDELERIALTSLTDLLRQGKAMDEAIATLRRMMNPDLVDRAVEHYNEVAKGVREYRDPPTLKDPDRVPQPWYLGPRPDDLFWPALEGHLSQKPAWRGDPVTSLDRASTKVVSYLAPPWARTIRTRGLVLGYVQSGKTSNFTAVMAKAADAGYRLMVVLSGVHNNLRRQTQLRLDEQIVDLNPLSWVPLTTEQADFGRPVRALPLLAQPGLRLLAVVKKNAKRLDNLVSWLDDAGQAGILDRCPILVIDDEADQASLNTKKEEEERAAINALILRLLAFPKVAYVGYTATPFGNLFVDPSIPDDLYPRDFIVDLPRPANYFGPERLFGRQRFTPDEPEFMGHDMIRIVPDDEAAALRPPRKKADRDAFEPAVTPSLDEALRWFLLATSARTVRTGEPQHSTMLIHSSQYVATHALLWRPVCDVLRDVRTRLANADAALIAELRTQWEAEIAKVPAEEVGAEAVAFDDVLAQLPGTLTALGDLTTVEGSGVVVDNSFSVRRLVYDEDDPRPVVVIGGNTLSRGLTLEGLVVSHFIRTASTYDTLLQMGRWFGFRSGYEDLPRMWMTADLELMFRFLAGVEHEIRLDIARYETEGLTPLQMAVRVRTHPKIAITSALKMRKAVGQKMSFSGQRPQTILFHHRDAEWLNGNLDAGRRLIAAASARGIVPEPRGPSTLLAGLPVEDVFAFLDPDDGYRFHELNAELQTSPLRSYIEAQNRYDELETWNVVVMSRKSDELGTVDLGLREPVNLITRAKLTSSPPEYANINTLMSKVDRVADLHVPGAANLDDNALLVHRTASGRGLILMYPISKDSQPDRNRGSDRRAPLGAEQHMLGVAFAFPVATFDPTPQNYKVVDLSGVEDVDEVEAAEEPPPGLADEDGEASCDDPIINAQ